MTGKAMWAVGLVTILLILVGTLGGSTPRAAAADQATGRAPGSVADAVGPDLVRLFRIESVRTCGGNVNECMKHEAEPLVLARVALGESPESPGDQIYIMWLIRLRAELGFKNAGVPGNGTGWCGDFWCYTPGHWGSPTSIYREALCDGGCQFEAVAVAERIAWPCAWSEHFALRKMLCPTDEQLPDFLFAYQVAQRIAAASLSDFPWALRGYDNFRAPTITSAGQYLRDGGLPSAQFFPRANVWRDEFKDDNLYWERTEARRAGPDER